MFSIVFIYFASAMQLSIVFLQINLYIADSLLDDIDVSLISVTRIASWGLFLSLLIILFKLPTYSFP